MYMAFKNEFLIPIFLLQARENEKRLICLFVFIMLKKPV